MKKILYIFISSLLLLSCNSLLDLDPITEQSEKQFYRTESDAFQAMVAVYDVLQWTTPRSQNCPFEVISEQISDCCYGGGGSASDVPFIVKMSGWQIDSNDPAMDALWYKYYAGIFRANKFLEVIGDIPFEKESDKKRMIAEVYFLRAYYYFDLVRLFGNVPLILKTLEPSEYYTQVQVDPSVVYGQIKNDLEFAIKNGLPDRNKIPVNDNGRISKHAAEALLGRVWLYYTGTYEKTDMEGLTKEQVTAYVEDVIENSGASLMPDYADIFKTSKKNNQESIFEIQYTSASNWGDWEYREGSEGNNAIILWGIRDPQKDSPYATGWSFAPVRASLWDEFDANDSRREATLVNMALEGYTYKPGYQNTGFFNKKYTALKENESSTNREHNFSNNYINIRFADVLLMGAELQLDQNATKAQSHYEKVVKRAKGATATVPTATKSLIMKERLLELALEGHRYWDLRRQGLNVAKNTIEKENSIVTNEFKKTFDLKYQGLMPIPQTQIIQCKLLKQNAGY